MHAGRKVKRLPLVTLWVSLPKKKVSMLGYVEKELFLITDQKDLNEYQG